PTRTVTEAATIQRGSDEIWGNRITTFRVHPSFGDQSGNLILMGPDRNLQLEVIHVFVTHSLLADVEVVDPKKCLEESCKPKCVKPLLEYQACVKRVQGDESGHKHCTGQYFDYWQCVDKCVGPKLFAELK
ncbi:hypothetical protein HID58_006988, partial [Brassica napus]